MSFVDVEIPTQKNKRLDGTPKDQREQRNKVTKEHLNHRPVAFNETEHSAVRFAPDERPNALDAFLYLPWMSKNTEYLIISDSDASDSEDQEKVRKNSKNFQENKNSDVKMEKKETDPILLKNDQQTFLDKLSTLTKDIGHFFAHPTANVRQYFRRRDGYLPPDQRLIQETTSNEK